MKTLKLLQRNLICILLTCVLCVGCDGISPKFLDSEEPFVVHEIKGTKSSEVCEGQIWVYERDIENPFETAKRDTCYVVEVRGGYVKYKQNGSIKNNEIYWFKVGSRRIK